MNAEKMLADRNGRRHWMRAVLLGLGLLSGALGCADEREELELEESAQQLKVSSMLSGDAVVAQASTRKLGALQTGGGGVLAGGTIVVAFTQDPDGAWHCHGDADCNRMFLSGVCKGGILDSSCDTTRGVECWCY